MEKSVTTSFESQPYYHVGGERVQLYPDPELFVVRFEATARQEPESLPKKVRILLSKAQPIDFLPREGMELLRIPSGQKTVRALRRTAGISRILPVYRRAPGSGGAVIITSRLLVQFKPDLTPAQVETILRRHGLRVLDTLPYARPHGFLLETDPGADGLGALVAANGLVETGLVVFAEPDLIQTRRQRRSVPPDPLLAAFLTEQWHLQAIAAPKAWDVTRGDPAIRIAILDDGFDCRHPELGGVVATGELKVAAQYDFATGTTDASPKSLDNNHGTACAGLVASAGHRAAGVAPGCRLILARLPNLLDTSGEAAMFQWAADAGSDVICCSWGFDDGFGTVVPLPTPTRLAIRYCIESGRTGRGVSIFWAAGNGAEAVSDDHYASNPDVMTIAACTARGTSAAYSDFGPEIFACAPSDGEAGDPAIFTTDRQGAAGFHPGDKIADDPQGDYTNSFGGTSAAAPIAAGVAALVLSVNPDLTAAQVRELLQRTTDRIGDAADYDPNGHSDKFGYGRLNAARAVDAALGTVATAISKPVIVGPTQWPRDDGPPTFRVNPGPNAYYLVEISSDPALFDNAYHGHERTPDSFYGSWTDPPLSSGPTYALPPAVWARLRAAPRLWYRVGSSGDSLSYVNYMVSVLDDEGLSAPSFEILPGMNAPPPAALAVSRSVDAPSGVGEERLRSSQVVGPRRWEWRLGPPIFRVEAHGQVACRLKVSADPKALASDQSAGGSTKDRVFTVDWAQDHAAVAHRGQWFQRSSIPFEIWEQLRGRTRLYYQLIVLSDEPVRSPVHAMDLIEDSASETAWSGPDEPLRRSPMSASR